jgi:peptide/nickel transport system substrate-binding protein
MEDAFETNRTGFVNSSFWSSGFIGIGPYRLTGWEPGSAAYLLAADTFYGSPPRIRNIVFRSIPDINTGMANILAGDVDVWLGSSLGIEQARLLKTEWEARGGGQVISYPRLTHHVRFQPDETSVADVRVRKALYHAMDRESIVHDLFFGLVQVAHSWIIPGTSGFDTIDARTTKYPYDPARAQSFMAELGYVRGVDGALRDQRGGPFALEFSTTLGNQERESVQAVIANQWKAAGFQVSIHNAPLSVTQEPGYQFAATDLSGLGADFESNIPRIDGRNLRTAQNPRGANSFGYANSEVDALLDEWLRTPERTRQIQIEAAVIHRMSEDLPILQVSYRLEAAAARTGVRGVPPRTAMPGATNTWNVESWQLDNA